MLSIFPKDEIKNGNLLNFYIKRLSNLSVKINRHNQKHYDQRLIRLISGQTLSNTLLIMIQILNLT